MHTLELLERIAALDARGSCVLDDEMVELLMELPSHIPAILSFLDRADDACASLESMLLHLAMHMQPADKAARTHVVSDLAQGLITIGYRA